MQTIKLGPVLFWTILVTLFVIIASSVSLVAAGYQFDWKTRRLTQTSLIFLSGRPRDAQVSINGQWVANRLPLRLSSVVPGTYDVVVEKEGYIPWRKTFSLDAGAARAETDIRLFLTRVEVSDVTDPELIQTVTENTSPSPLISDHELRVGSRLVTRVSGELKSAAASPDRSHIFFQVGRDVRVVEADGTNELLLFTLSAEESSNLLVLADGTELVLLDGTVVRRLRVS